MAAKVTPAGGTFTIFGDAADGTVNALAAAADGAGSTLNLTGTSVITVGETNDGQAYEGFIAFDTSVVTGTITSVTLSMFGVTDSTSTDFIIEVRAHDWGTTVTTGDWLSRATMATKTLVASRSTSGFSSSGYNVFTSDAAFLTAVNQSGFTRLFINSSSHRVAPAGSTRYVNMSSADEAGTGQDPKLVVVST